MPETSLEDVLDTMEVMVEAENSVARFYLACATRFTKDAQFWASLAEEEFLHAEAISKLAQLIRKKPHRFEPGNLSPLSALRDFIAKINTKADRVSSGALSESGALLAARHIESTFIEGKYPEAVLTDIPKYNQILDNLVLRSQKHKNIVSKRIRKSKSKQEATSDSQDSRSSTGKEESTLNKEVREGQAQVTQSQKEGSRMRAFSGMVEGIDILDYLQFVLFTGRQTVLKIETGDGRAATLFLRDQNIVHAACGDLQGEEAFYACTRFSSGSFTHLPWTQPKQVTIDKVGELMLLEAARRRDEAI